MELFLAVLVKSCVHYGGS